MFDWTESACGFECCVKNCFMFKVEPASDEWIATFSVGDVLIRKKTGYTDSQIAKEEIIGSYISFIEECLSDIAAGTVRKKYILLIEDQKMLADTMMAFLKREGYMVYWAKDGHEGLEMLREHEIDIVVTDLKMPNMSGEEFLEILKRKYHSTLPVIVQTAFGTAENSTRLMKLGVCDILMKPYGLDELKKSIQNALAEF